MKYVTKKQVRVEVFDLRPDVLNKKVSPTYVGVMRALFGNPWSMNTESGQPLADDLATAIRNGLQYASIRTILPDQISNQSPDINLILKIYDWECDTYKTTDFNYDLELQVTDSKNAQVGIYRESNKSRGNVTVQSVVEAAKHALTKLLNSDPISKAIKE